MSKEPSLSKRHEIELIIRGHCKFSTTINREVNTIMESFPHLHLKVTSIEDAGSHYRPFGGITPALWVNKKLIFLGSFDPERFRARLKAL